MKNICMRFFAAVLCMTVLMSGLPAELLHIAALAETEIQIVEASEAPAPEGESVLLSAEPTEQPDPEPGVASVDESVTAAPAGESSEAPSEVVSEAPAGEPAEVPVEESTEMPSEESVETPSEEPVEEPTGELSDAPSEEPVEEPVEEPTGEPSEAPSEEPVEEPTGELSDAPSEEPTGEPSEAPTEEPAEQPTEDAVPGGEVLPEDMPADEGILMMNVNTVESTIAEWIAELNAKEYAREFDRVLWLHDKLTGHVSDDRGKTAAQSIEAALVGGKAGSIGYALAYAALLDAADVDNVVVYGANNPRQAWNVVKIGGEWTHIDAFANEDAHDGHAYFGLTDAAMARDHSWEDSAPACTGTKYNYFVQEEGYLAYANLEQLAALTGGTTQGKIYAAGGDDPRAAIEALAAEWGLLAEIESYGSYAEFTFHQGVAAIVPAQASVTIGVKQKLSVADWTLEPAGAAASVTYESSAEKYATVSEEGLVTGKKAGTAYITITTDSGVSCQVKVTVQKAPSSIKLKAARSTLGVGETTQLSYTLSSKSAGSVSYTSDDESVAIVDAQGVVTAVGPGNCEITAKTHNGKKDEVEIKVKPAPESIRLSAEALTLGAEDSYTLKYTLNDGAEGSVSFASSDESIAAVDASGKITAVAEGSCVITAEAYNGLRVECALAVVPAPERIAIVAERTTLGRKETMQISVTADPDGAPCSATYKSSKSSVVSVSKDGVLTAKKAGSATITATSYNGKTAEIKITVKKEPKSIKLSAERTTLGLGEGMQLSATLSSGTAGAYSFSSSDPAIASIDSEGRLTTHAAGKVSITAKTFNGKKHSLSFTICEAPTEISFDRESVLVGREDSIAVPATVNKGSAGAIRYASSDEGIAAVDVDTGRLTAIAEGICTITAESYNGLTAQLQVEVIAAPERIAIVADHTTMGRKEEMQLSVEAEPEGCACSVTWKSSKTSVVSVSKDGLLTAKKTGTATITATSYNGKTATVKITVKKAPSSIKLSAASKKMGVGEQLQLSATLSSGSAGGYSFESSDPAIASVNARGVLMANGVGSVTVTVKSFNGKKSSADFEVLGAPELLVLDGGDIEVGVGGTATAFAYVNEGAAGAVTYEVADTDIADVDPKTGKIKAKAEGVTTLTATTYNGISDAVALSVRPAPSFIEFEEGTLYIGVGDSIQLEPLMDEDSMATLKYTTSKSKYASVTSGGVVKGVRVGNATITVKTHNGLSDTIKVVVKKAPSSVALEPKAIVLGVGEEYALDTSWTSGAYTSLTYGSVDERIVTIDNDGYITAQGLGEAAVFVTTHNGKSAECIVTVLEAPEYVNLFAPEEMGVGDEFRLEPALSPDSHSALEFSIVSGNALKVSSNGVLRAVQPGIATVRVQTYLEDVYAEAEILVRPAPEAIEFDEDSYTVDINKTLQLKPQVLPEGAFGTLKFEAEKDGYFTVDESGLVTPVMNGIARVKVSSYNGLVEYVTIRVYDPDFPESVTLGETPAYLDEDEKFKISYEVFPKQADADMMWSSSDEDVATVSGETVRAKSYGKVTITGVSKRNPALSVSFTLTVISDERCLVMPARRTGTSEISSNLKKISNVENSAYRELDMLLATGVIDQADYNKRKKIVSNAFDMYAFPWMTKSLQQYWKEANDEDGAKDFKPGIVYYGLPYINTPWANRLYNVSKATSEGRYTDTGKGYYLLNQDKLLNKMYVGNDCSSFVSMAIWGLSGSSYNDTTNGIAKSASYVTIEDYKDMRPGDLLNWKDMHVVMFLYYANASKTQMVIIEQGGSEPAISTINCSVKRVSDYAENYVIRRLKTLA